ncbi:uncharacterized protein LOC124952839 isoform X2 [Vespa velutina]|uniref:uncharacterized protein LOC124952839 isoform X2 n=1 Tax=Vespa velutina TaxID=202808 RepID=UPI001FB3521E|nr:uncharacterized protein LOC124952839 isoform X2 [Vespa velutina]
MQIEIGRIDDDPYNSGSWRMEKGGEADSGRRSRGRYDSWFLGNSASWTDITSAILYTRPSGEVMFDANRETALNCLNCARLSEAAPPSYYYFPTLSTLPPSSCPEINRHSASTGRYKS